MTISKLWIRNTTVAIKVEYCCTTTKLLIVINHREYTIYWDIWGVLAAHPPIYCTPYVVTWPLGKNCSGLDSMASDLLVDACIARPMKCQLTPSIPTVRNCCFLKGSVPYWSNPSFLIFDIRALWRSVLSARVPECQNIKNDGLNQYGKV